MKSSGLITTITIIACIATTTTLDAAAAGDSEFKCSSKDTTTCQCSRNTQHDTTYELECPSIFDAQYTVYYTPDKLLRIECHQGFEYMDDEVLHQLFHQAEKTGNESIELDVDALPHINSDSIVMFKMSYCHLPNRRLEHILSGLNVKEIKLVVYDNSSFSGTTRLTRDYFTGVRTMLKGFELKLSNIDEIDEDALDGIDLELIKLTYIKMKHVKRWFKAMSGLKSLDLHGNSIETIESGAFDDLIGLETLHLQANDMQTINSTTFARLVNLRSLELMRNQLTHIPSDLLTELPNLQLINLSQNNLTSLPDDLFKHNQHLTSIRLEYNELTHLPAAIFANLPNLTIIRIEFNKIATLSMDAFKDNILLETLWMNNNHLSELPRNCLKAQKNLKTLLLSRNNLSNIDGLFAGLTNIEKIHLQYNKITQINRDAFESCRNLKELNISYNRLRQIDYFAFRDLLKVLDMNLSHNQLSFEGYPFGNCIELHNLDLSFNNLSVFDSEFMLTKTSLQTLDLNYNFIKYIDVVDFRSLSNYTPKIYIEHNQLHEVDFGYAKSLPFTDSLSSQVADVYINHNPFDCTGRAFDLVKYLHEKIDERIRAMVELHADKLQCSTPANFVGRRLMEIPIEKVSTPVEQCPRQCKCDLVAYDETLMVDCTLRNLINAPRINTTGLVYKRMEVHLEYNYIREYPPSGYGYESADTLNLSHNLLENVTWLPPGIKALHLDHNKFTRLNTSQLAHRKDLNLSLHNNPWICDCVALDFIRFVKDHQRLIKDGIKCNETNQLIREIKEEDLCHSHTVIIAIAVTCIAFFITLISVLCVLYYKYKQEIKVWLYAHNMLMWLITEDDLDRDKLYDAFLSYSHVDEDFVVDELVSKLEGGANPYKLCIHTRNWMPGEFIAKQIVESVQNSRRTIVVLSPHFLESVWGIMEFRTAHLNALKEGRVRVIIILYGDLDPKTQLDDEISAYLKTNTYIKWGDPWFWEKLRYALPHQIKQQQQQIPAKLEKINIKLDKMDLINGNTSPNVGSTPPIGPLLLKQHPLEFRMAPNDAQSTPPAAQDLAITVTC